MRRIGVFGGTFDPVHIGHLAAAQDATIELALDQVLFVPNYQPPHKLGSQVGESEHRAAMVELATTDNERFAVSTVELDRTGPSYTLDTMRLLSRQLEGASLFFLLGSDALAHLHTWHEPEALLREFRVVIMERAGQNARWEVAEGHFPGIRELVDVIRVAGLDVSSHDIRRRVAHGEPIRYLVVPAVDRYIQEHGLYRSRAQVSV